MNTRPDPHGAGDYAPPGPINHALSAVAWYTPELAGVAVTTAAAATVWPPLAVISAALAGRIAHDQLRLAARNRRVRREVVEQRRDKRRQLDHDTDDTDEGAASSVDAGDGDGSGWEVAG